MKAIALIPARLEASRFPKKLLTPILGKSVLLRTYESALQTGLFDDVVVVADHDDLINEIINNGGKAIKSKGTYESGTDRIAEVALHLDADIFMLDESLIYENMSYLINNHLDLLTVRFKTINGDYNSVYDVFYYFQKLTKYISPFCLGGFMLISTKRFNEIGGFDETVKVAEDYLLTRHINSNRFGIVNKVVYTTPRRFKNKGMFYMIKLFVSSFLNRNNKKYFKEDNGYWL